MSRQIESEPRKSQDSVWGRLWQKRWRIARGAGIGAVVGASITARTEAPLEQWVVDFGNTVGAGVERFIEPIHTDSLRGEPIEGREKGLYQTINYDGGVPFPVRKGPDQSGLAGYAQPGQIVLVEPWWGSTYEGYPGGRVQVGDEQLGEWFKIDEIKLFEEKDGKYIEIGKVQDVFVSGNFLTEPPSESDNQADAQ